MIVLKDIVSIEKGKRYDLLDEFKEGAIRVFQANDFRNENKPLYTTESEGVLTNENDILVVWDGSVGQMGFGKSGYVGSTIVRVRVKNQKEYSPFFIYKFLQTKSEFLKRKSTGATIQHINRKSLEQLVIPSIPFSEQIQIANILSQVETLIEQRKESIVLLDEFLKSTFLEMFGDPITNKKNWEKVKLSTLGSIDRGVSKNRPRNSPQLLGGDYPLIQTGEVTNAGLYITSFTKTYSEIGLKQSKLWKKGTMLITIAANIARTSILSFEACFPDSIAGFVANTKEAETIYVYYLFIFFQRILEDGASQTAQKNINLELLRKLLVPKPPIELQTQFANIVGKTEALKEQYKNSLLELGNLYDSLSQRAFDSELKIEMEGKLNVNF